RACRSVFLTATATPALSTLSLHDALPILPGENLRRPERVGRRGIGADRLALPHPGAPADGAPALPELATLLHTVVEPDAQTVGEVSDLARQLTLRHPGQLVGHFAGARADSFTLIDPLALHRPCAADHDRHHVGVAPDTSRDGGRLDIRGVHGAPRRAACLAGDLARGRWGVLRSAQLARCTLVHPDVHDRGSAATPLVVKLHHVADRVPVEELEAALRQGIPAGHGAQGRAHR